jgi:hypothetical protein
MTVYFILATKVLRYNEDISKKWSNKNSDVKHFTLTQTDVCDITNLSVHITFHAVPKDVYVICPAVTLSNLSRRATVGVKRPEPGNRTALR